jgi:hypothetical protein
MNIIKLVLSIGMIYNVIKGNIQNATFIGVCLILTNFYGRTR